MSPKTKLTAEPEPAPLLEAVQEETESLPGLQVSAEPAEPEKEAPAKAIEELRGKYKEEKEERREKKKRGRPKKKALEEEVKADENLQKSIAAFQSFGNLALNIIIPRLPNPVPVSDAERAMWNETFSNALEKYLPMLGGWDVELALGLCVIVIFAPRFQKPKEEPKTAKPLEEEAVATP